MATEQTISLPGARYRTRSGGQVREWDWSTVTSDPAIDDALTPAGNRYLVRLLFYRNTAATAGQIGIFFEESPSASFGTGDDLSAAFESGGSVTINLATGETLTLLMSESDDATEEYRWDTGEDGLTLAEFNGIWNRLNANQVGSSVTIRDFAPGAADAVAPSWTDSTGAAQSWTAGTAITDLVVPAVDAGTPAPAYAVVGSLPAGLSFAAGTRTISGTPTAAGSGTITIRATNSAGSDDWTVAYTIAAAPPATVAPSWTDSTGTAQSWTADTAITDLVVPAVDAGTPAPAYAVVGSLPAGLSFAAGTRTISGTPTAAGSGTITIRATNSAGSDDWTVAYTIAAAPPATVAPSWTDSTGTAQSWTADTAITDLVVPAVDAGTPAPAYAVVGSLPAGLSFAAGTRTISGTPTAAGSGTITIRATNSAGSDDWTVAYTITAAPVDPPPTSEETEQTISLPGARYRTRSGGQVREWDWSTVTSDPAIDDALTPAGDRYLVRLLFYRNTAATAGQIGIFFEESPSASFGTGDDLSAAFESGGSVTINLATGETLTLLMSESDDATEEYRWDTGEDGLTLAEFNGIWNRLNANQVGSSVTIRDFAPEAADAVAPSWTDSTGAAQSWTADTAITDLVVPAVDAGTPAPAYAVVGSLPAGLSFAAGTRTISGTPTAAGSGTITIRATNSAGSDDWTVAYTIAAAPPATVAPSWTDSTGAAQSWTAGTAITPVTIPAASGTSPAYSAAGLPAGLQFSSRRITGTPTAAGSGTITITARNSAGTATYTVAWTVAAASTPPVDPPAPTDAARGLRVRIAGTDVSKWVQWPRFKVTHRLGAVSTASMRMLGVSGVMPVPVEGQAIEVENVTAGRMIFRGLVKSPVIILLPGVRLVSVKVSAQSTIVRMSHRILTRDQAVTISRTATLAGQWAALLAVPGGLTGSVSLRQTAPPLRDDIRFQTVRRVAEDMAEASNAFLVHRVDESVTLTDLASAAASGERLTGVTVESMQRTVESRDYRSHQTVLSGPIVRAVSRTGDGSKRAFDARPPRETAKSITFDLPAPTITRDILNPSTYSTYRIRWGTTSGMNQNLGDASVLAGTPGNAALLTRLSFYDVLPRLASILKPQMQIHFNNTLTRNRGAERLSLEWEGYAAAITISNPAISRDLVFPGPRDFDNNIGGEDGENPPLPPYQYVFGGPDHDNVAQFFDSLWGGQGMNRWLAAAYALSPANRARFTLTLTESANVGVPVDITAESVTGLTVNGEAQSVNDPCIWLDLFRSAADSGNCRPGPVIVGCDPVRGRRSASHRVGRIVTRRPCGQGGIGAGHLDGGDRDPRRCASAGRAAGGAHIRRTKSRNRPGSCCR